MKFCLLVILLFIFVFSLVGIADSEENLPIHNLSVLLEKEKDAGWQDRKKILIDYQSYVVDSEGGPLKDFIKVTDLTLTAIGQEKGTMLFHMLKNLVGENTFYSASRRLLEEKKLEKTSWVDVEKTFEEVSGKDLGWFFSQWLERTDIPSLEVKNLKVVVLKGVPRVSFEILQEERPYKLDLPVRVITEKGEVKDILHIENESQAFNIAVKEKPLRIVFDEDYDLMRKLTEEEYPPVIARLLGDKKRLIIFPERGKEKYSELITVFEKKGFEAKEEKELKDEDIRTHSLLVLGLESPILKRLFGQINKTGPGFNLIVKQNPLNIEKVIAYAYSDSKEEISSAARRIFTYANFSSIRFQGGENIEKETEETERGITFSLYEPVHGVNPRRAIKLTDIINDVIDKPIIYIGERHTNYEDHRVQLELIMELSKRGRKFAIGMEMFQRPFQKAIDDYLSGVISEREFLKASEYFKRWKYDYNLYREIIEFAKAKKIPVVALNLREEIVKKVAAGGLDALTPLEKKEIPQDMDMSDEDYRERLMGAFRLHERTSIKNFDNFYQAQILWDETMAHSIAEFMLDKPGYQMVVLAGEQHIMFSSGIPKRTYRLNRKDYTTLINGVADDFNMEIGDFVLFPDFIALPASPKLGILLKKEEGRLKIEDFQPGSSALKAGLKKGDVLISVDDWKVESIEDVRIALFDKKQGDTVKVKVLRKKFLFGETAVEFPVTL